MNPTTPPKSQAQGLRTMAEQPPPNSQDMEMASPPAYPPLRPPGYGNSHSDNAHDRPSSSNVFSLNSSSQRPTVSSVKFASTSNAFGLSSSSSSSTSTNAFGSGSSTVLKTNNLSPPSAGTVTTRRLRRPSLLSLTRNASYTSASGSGSDDTPATAIGFFAPASTSQHQVKDPSSSTSNPFVISQDRQQPLQPTPRWSSHASVNARTMIRRISSAPIIPFEELKTSTPPLPLPAELDMPEGVGGASGSNSPVEMDGEPRSNSHSSSNWLANVHSQEDARRKGKARMPLDDITVSGPASPLFPTGNAGDGLHAPPFTGRPLPSALVATLISEHAPLEHEMLSEARLQRLINSHPQRLPFTPRAPRGSRGRFPDQVGGDDDDEDEALSGGLGRTWARRTWMGRKIDDSDSDSEEEEQEEQIVEPVNSAFAAGMDMDRPGSSSSSGMWMSTKTSDSGKSTPNNGQGTTAGAGVPNASTSNEAQTQPCFPTPPSNNTPWPTSATTNAGGGGWKSTSRLSFGSAGAGMVPSPGSGFGLPSAFGSLGMGGGGGVGTPLASPTIERLELAGSPSGMGMGMPISSPGFMQYRESQGGSASIRPGKRKAQVGNDDRFDPYKRPRGSSPSFSFSAGSPLSFPLSPSSKVTSIPIPQSPHRNSMSMSMSMSRPIHPYSRPMNTRSRAVSPALSVSLGTQSQWSGSGIAGPGAVGLSGGISTSLTSTSISKGQGQGQGQLGGLGLLSLVKDSLVEEQDEQEQEQEDIVERREHGVSSNSKYDITQHGHGRQGINDNDNDEQMEED